MLLLKTLTGSRLYGTASPDSDYDYICVYSENIKSRHKIKDGYDVQEWSLSTFMKLAWKGSHNALDIMWCPVNFPEVDLLTAMRLGFRVDPWVAWPRFIKTIQSVTDRDDRKGRLHAARLQHNLDSIMDKGWYDPTEFARVTNWREIE